MLELGTRTDNRVTYDEAIMYCFCLGDGWRLPTKTEVDISFKYDDNRFIGCWFQDRKNHGVDRWLVYPVREVKDA